MATSLTSAWDPALFEDLLQDSDKGTLERALRDITFSDVLPTPPPSDNNTPDGDDDDQRLVSVSTTFFPGATLDTLPPDLILLSADAVFFNVHTHRLLVASDNGFAGLLPAASPPRGRSSDARPDGTQAPIVSVTEPAPLLNLVLHAAYGMACTHYAPTFDALSGAVDAARKYGLTSSAFLAPGAPLFEALLVHAPAHALNVYALAARNDAHELAVLVSSHLLSLSLASLTDDDARAIGPVYLKRLFFLHLGRADALKRLLITPPPSHPPTSTCGIEERGRLTRAWALAAAYLAWESRPDVLPSTIEAACRPLQDQLSCDRCRALLQERTRNLVLQWTMVKGTI